MIREAFRYGMAPVLVAGALTAGKPAIAEPLIPQKSQECTAPDERIDMAKTLGNVTRQISAITKRKLYGYGEGRDAKGNYEMTETLELNGKEIGKVSTHFILNEGMGYLWKIQTNPVPHKISYAYQFTTTTKGPDNPALDNRIDWNCIDWTPDDSKFIKPSGIDFEVIR